MSYPITVRHGRILEDIDEELLRAERKFSAFNSYHEGKAIIEEEFEELWEEIKKKNADADKIRNEAIQLGAMVVRFISDLIDREA